MIRWLISVAVHLAANAIALWVADLLLDDFNISWNGFIVAVLIFTGVEVLVEPLFTKDDAQVRVGIAGRRGPHRDPRRTDRH